MSTLSSAKIDPLTLRTPTVDQGQNYARKLELLLERFPHPDGRPWRGSEIQEETRGFVSAVYFSSLRTGKYARPGIDILAAIAAVIGFPLELWVTDPVQWPHILREKEPPEYPSGNGLSISDRFKLISSAVRNPRTNEPFTDEEIVQLSRGRLTPGDLKHLRAEHEGELSCGQLLVLSQLFRIDFDYWVKDLEEPAPLIDSETIEALEDPDNCALLLKATRLSPAHKTMLVLLADQLAALQEGQELQS